MLCVVTEEAPELGVANTVYLIRSSWTDFGYRTKFAGRYYDDDEQLHDLGLVRIMKVGTRAGDVPLPDSFDHLDESFVSLGDQAYYVAVAALPVSTREGHLLALRDCVRTPQRFGALAEDRVLRSSPVSGHLRNGGSRRGPRLSYQSCRSTPMRNRGRSCRLH